MSCGRVRVRPAWGTDSPLQCRQGGASLRRARAVSVLDGATLTPLLWWPCVRCGADVSTMVLRALCRCLLGRSLYQPCRLRVGFPIVAADAGGLCSIPARSPSRTLLYGV